jgi:hypothetical protein
MQNEVLVVLANISDEISKEFMQQNIWWKYAQFKYLSIMPVMTSLPKLQSLLKSTVTIFINT